MAKDKTTKERLTTVEVQLNHLSEDIGEIKSGVKGLESLHKEQNGLLARALGKIEKHITDHEEDSNFWTLQQYIAGNPFKAIMVSVTGALIVFTLLVFSNETVVKELLEFLKLLL